jgi:hypothetical protein
VIKHYKKERGKKMNKVAFRVIQVSKKSGKKVVLNAHTTQAGARAYAKKLAWFYRNAIKFDYVVEAFIPALDLIPSLYDRGLSA